MSLSSTPFPPTMPDTASSILLIEDCRADRVLLQMRCRTQGLSIDWQVTGSCAETDMLLQRIDAGEVPPPALAIIDQRLPDGDGGALILRLADRLPGTRLILFSGTPPVTPAELPATVAVDRLVKPGDFAGYDEILAIIRQTMLAADHG